VNVLLAISPSVRQRTKNSLNFGGPGAEPPAARCAQLGKTLIEGVGNYLIAAHPQIGNSVIVSRSRKGGYLGKNIRRSVFRHFEVVPDASCT